MKKLIIFGTGLFAEVAYFYFSHDSEYEVVGFTVTSDHLDKKKLFDLPVVSFDTLESLFPPSSHSVFVAIGYLGMNKIREKICNNSKNKGYKLASYVNSKATTWNDLSIGENCFVLENNVIQPFVKIGNGVILWSGNHIGHHTKIYDYCFIASHAVISGNVEIGERCFIGVNSTIRDDIKIAPECLIGANVYVSKNTLPKEVYKSTNFKPISISSDEIKHF